MEPLRLDDPRHLGSYTTVGRVDAAAGEVPVPVRRFVARAPGGDCTVLISVPLPEFAQDGAYGERFLAEAEHARQLGACTPWMVQVVEASPPLSGSVSPPVPPSVPPSVSRPASTGGGQLPWYATPYVPALPLPGALRTYGGGLPERTVRALGLALAEVLTVLHERGLAHAGVSPGAVLMSADGPLLTAFGGVRALAPGGHGRSALPGFAMAAVPPEQVSGGRPRPLGDIYAMGAVLSYASGGQLEPDVSRLPESIRALVRACLADDPADRPQATAVRDELRAGASLSVPPARGSASAHPQATVLDSAQSAFGPGWLPGRVIAGIVRQSADVLGASLPS